MTNVIKLNDRRPTPPVKGATPVYWNGIHRGWLMPQATVPPITRKYR